MNLGRLRRECTTVTIDYVERIRFDYHCYVYSALVCTGVCIHCIILRKCHCHNLPCGWPLTSMWRYSHWYTMYIVH